MLSYLLDENISWVVAGQVGGKRADIPVQSLHSWHEGAFVATDDRVILDAACGEGLTLVTYDVSTIVPLLVEWAHAGIPHAGVLFVDQRTIAGHLIGGLVRALIAHWDAHRREEWTNRVDYLRAAG